MTGKEELAEGSIIIRFKGFRVRTYEWGPETNYLDFTEMGRRKKEGGGGILLSYFRKL